MMTIDENNYKAPPPPDSLGFTRLGREGFDNVTKSFFILVFILITLLGLYGIATSFTKTYTACELDRRSVACLDQRVQECIALETYTRQECIELVGGQP